MGKRTPRSDGRLEKKIQIGYHPNGKPNRISVYGHTQRELKENYEIALDRIKKGLSPMPNKTTLGQWADRWEEIYLSGGYKHRQKIKSCIKKIKNNPIGGTPLEEIKPIDVKAFYKTLSHLVDLSRTTADTLNSLFETAIDNDLILKNPARNVHVECADKRKVKALTDPEESALLLCDLTIKQRCYCAFGLYAGLRPGETRAITRYEAKEILQNDAIKIWKTASVDADGNPCIKECPKTEAGNRILPLKPELKTILQDYLSSDMCSKGVYLFEKRGGGFLTEASHRRIMESVESKFKKTFLETASKETLLQIPEPDDLTYYRLRHTFITRLWYEGVDVKDAQYLAGHENVQLTLDVYTDAENDHKIHAKLMQRWTQKEEKSLSGGDK